VVGRQWEVVGLNRSVLLAKSITEDYSEADLWAMRLPGHLEQGILAAKELEVIAPIICDVLQLDYTPSELITAVKLAIWLHDWGKVNIDFLSLVENKSKKSLLNKLGIYEPLSCVKKQAIRHELLSCILVQSPKVRQWLEPHAKFLPVALLAVLGHHLKVKDSSYFNLEIAISLKVFTEAEDFKRVLQLGVKHFGLSETLPKLPAKYQEEQLKQGIYQFKEWANEVDRKCRNDFDKLRKIAVIKALTMACDLAASALLEKHRGNRNYTQWIREALNETMTAEICQEVIESKLGDRKLLDFQKNAAKSKARVVIVVAGCGAGKSLIAYARLNELAIKGLKAKLFFCYPTTSTTTQGFMDYAANKVENALLEHSRKWVDEQLRGFSEIYDDEPEGGEERFQTRAEALRIWHSQLIYCTAHTVLGLLQNYRKGLYGFPAIVQGFFVFDEIHAYPPELFGTLLEFVRIFRNSQIVLMTASLPPSRKEALEAALAKNDGEKPEIIYGPIEIETLNRYRLQAVYNEGEELWEKAIAELKQGGKVLWVTNEVYDCQRLYTEAKKRFINAGVKITPICFHARFRYQDSIHQQDELVKAFRNDEPAFAVTTQIAEMSLDISCTLLISALAPLWALIQRLGRLNRWVEVIKNEYKLKTGRVCDALIYYRNRLTPYDKRQEDIKGIEASKKLLEQYSGQEINQKLLIEVMTQMELDQPESVKVRWLQTWLTQQGELMPPGSTIQVVLESDVPKIFKKAVKDNPNVKPSQEAQKWAVSVKIPKNPERWKREKAFKFYRVAPTEDIHYHSEIGAYETRHQDLVNIYGHQP
jgi:CRISPR-associated endonuclease/helicase Cas3